MIVLQQQDEEVRGGKLLTFGQVLALAQELDHGLVWKGMPGAEDESGTHVGLLSTLGGRTIKGVRSVLKVCLTVLICA